jgi:malonyl-CoA O-methyltransferase
MPVAVSAAEGYALWAEDWDSTPSPIAALEHRTLLPWIEALETRRALDIGCGTGRWTARFNAIGLDASPAMLAVAARKRGLSGRLAAVDAAALPIASGSIDAALCALTFGHIRNQAAAFREFARVLEPGGVLILTDFHPEAATRGWRRTFRREGQTYEIENYPYTLDHLSAAAPELALDSVIEASIGEPERELFERAGRIDLFDAACAMPAVLLTRWFRK